MIKVLTAVKDEVSNLFMEVQEAPTTATAIRNFSLICQNENYKVIQKNPKDFNLYLIGNYDTENGKIIGRDKPEVIAEATEFIEDKKEDK